MHLKKGQTHLHGADVIVLSVGVGLYIMEGTLKAKKETAAFSKTVEIYCCKDGKRGPTLVDGEDKFIKSGDLYWKVDVGY